MSLEDNLSLSNTLYDVPTEILIYIVSLLDLDSKFQFGRVCSWFHTLVHNPLWWTNFIWKSNGKYRDLENMKLVFKLHKNSLKKVSLTCWKEGFLASIIVYMSTSRCLQRISLTNFNTTKEDTGILMKIPTLSELHLNSEEPDSLFHPPGMGNRNLEVLNISSNNFDFQSWVLGDYYPPDVRVMLPRILSTIELVENKKFIDECGLSVYEPLSPIGHTAQLTFYQPPMKYVSLTSIPFVQFNFTPPSMKPTFHQFSKGSGMFELALVEDGVGSNIYTGAVSLPQHFEEVYIDVPSMCITSLQLLDQPNLMGIHLQKIAVKCPNLLHLDISHCDKCLANLNGLKEISSCCSKLESLNMDTENDMLPINLDILWQTIASMKKLKNLLISIYFIPVESGPIFLPALRAIFVLYQSEYKALNFTDRCFNFFTSMPSLSYFCFKSIPPTNVISGLTAILKSFTHLTHLYIHKIPGSTFTLPLDASCYSNLENIYLHCADYEFTEELADIISQCKGVKILALRILSISETSIKKLFDSLPFLLRFQVHTDSIINFLTVTRVGEFQSSLLEKAKSQGRMIDIKIKERELGSLLSQVQEHLFHL